MKYTIHAEGLTKIYGRGQTVGSSSVDAKISGTIALQNVSLDVRRGEIFGLLGRNGAGKTTFIRICGTQLMPTDGAVSVIGYDVVKEASEVRRLVSVVPQEGRTMEFLTPWEHVYGYLLLKGVDRQEAKRRATDILEELEVWDDRNIITFKLSGGLRQRTLVAMVLATDAEVYFCDEPTIGLDPIARRSVWRVLRSIRNEGKTIVLTTHYMEEAEALSDHLAILHRGQVLAQGTVEKLRSMIRSQVKVEVNQDFTAEELEPYGRVFTQEQSIVVLTDESASEELVKHAVAKGVKVTVTRTSLDDVFLELVGREK